MLIIPLNVLFIVTVVATQATDSARPKPSSLGGGTLGIVIPHLSGWGWNPTTTPPPETTGWPQEETTVGWGWEEPTTLPPPPPGWGWGGWAPPPPESEAEAVEIEMVAESAVVGEGESGATHGSQTLVTGDANNPAFVQLQSGSYSSLGQGSGVLQVSGISNAGDTSTFQGIDSYNFGDAGEYLGGALQGNSISNVNGGGSFVVGQGGIGQGGYSVNSALPESRRRRK